MLDKNTDFFKFVDNFTKTVHVPSFPIFESKFDFVPKVTIAIPTYKKTDLLKEAVDSAIAQVGYDSYDIIVVDNDPERDCETEKLMLSYHHPRLSYYKNAENIQMAGNWNRCFELAKGEFVVMLHDDDLLLPTFISECMDIINKKSNIGILKPLSFTWRDDKKPLQFSKSENSKSYKLQRLYDFSNFHTFMLGAPTGCLFRKQAVFNLGGFNQDFFPNLDFYFVVQFSQKNIVYNYNKILSIYRISNNESLKLATLKSSFAGTNSIRRQILKKYCIPQYFINQILSCNRTISMQYYKSYNSNFEYNIKSLGLKNSNKLEIILYKVFVKIYNGLLRFFTTENA